MDAPNELIARLRLICGKQHVLTSPSELAAYATGAAKPCPAVVVVPGTVNEVVAVSEACLDAGIRYAPRGATGSGLAGAELVMALSRLRRILAPDPACGRVTVEAGAPVAAVRRSLPEHMSVFTDLAASGVATVGGVLACGFGRSSLTALELVTAGGSLVRIERDADGYDLAGDFIGSRGRRGVAVRAELRVVREA